MTEIDTDAVRNWHIHSERPVLELWVKDLCDEIDRLNDQIAVLERTFVQPVLDRLNRD